MAKRRDSADSAGGIIVLLLAICLVVFVPLAWVILEIRRLAIRKPAQGFVLTDEEYRRAEGLRDRLSAAEQQVSEVETEALYAGCSRRADGMLDERNPKAPALNDRLAAAQTESTLASSALLEALAGPEDRFDAWSSAVEYVWAVRLVLSAWVGLAFAFPAARDAVWASLSSGDGFEAFVTTGFAAIPLIVVGFCAAMAGLAIGHSLVEDHRAPVAEELMRIGAAGANRGATDRGGREADETLEPRTALATIIAATLKWVAAADGRISEDERKLLELILSNSFQSWPDLCHLAILTLTTAPADDQAVVEEGCKLVASNEPQMAATIFTLSLMMSDEGGGPERARAAQVGSWLGLDSSELARITSEVNAQGTDVGP